MISLSTQLVSITVGQKTLKFLRFSDSHTAVTFNQTFGTCGKTGVDIPKYDDCRRETLMTGGSEVEVQDDGSRTLTIPQDGFYWFVL